MLQHAPRACPSQTEMGSVLVVVAEVIFHQPSQMPLVQNDDVVQ